jgi:hypothetical protein
MKFFSRFFEALFLLGFFGTLSVSIYLAWTDQHVSVRYGVFIPVVVIALCCAALTQPKENRYSA